MASKTKKVSMILSAKDCHRSNQIAGLPYAEETTAEDGEPLFENFKRYMVPDGIGMVPKQGFVPSKELRNRFSDADAQTIMRTRHLLTTEMKASDFTSQWISDFADSMIIECDWLKDPYLMILLCIDEMSFFSTSIPILKRLVSELHLLSYVKELVEGPFDGLYPKLQRSLSIQRSTVDVDTATQVHQDLQWKSNTNLKLVLQCQLFLGRVQIFLKVQEKDAFAVVTGTHFEKCKRYLQILEQHVVVIPDGHLPGANNIESATTAQLIEKICPETGEVVGVFRSWTHLERSHRGETINPNDLSAHLNGRTALYHGFIWRYVRQSNMPKMTTGRKYKKQSRELLQEEEENDYVDVKSDPDSPVRDVSGRSATSKRNDNKKKFQPFDRRPDTE